MKLLVLLLALAAFCIANVQINSDRLEYPILDGTVDSGRLILA